VKARLVPAARVEFLEALNYFQGQTVGLGRDFALDFGDTVKQIVRRPLACPAHLNGTRRCRLKRFRYGVVYRVLEKEIRVLAVMHLHRRPGYWRGRG
jgi:hypothetical protein